MIAAATMAIKLLPIITFFLMKEHKSSLFRPQDCNAALSLSYSPSQRDWDKFDTDSTEESPDSIHGNNKGPDHRDGLRRWKLFIAVIPAAVDEALYVLQWKLYSFYSMKKKKLTKYTLSQPLPVTRGAHLVQEFGEREVTPQTTGWKVMCLTGEGELNPVRW